MLSGLYEEVFLTSLERKAKGTEIKLRVDVDGERPMNAISGDVYSTSGRTSKYLSSFRFEGVKKVKNNTNEILITGDSGKFDPDSNHFRNIKVIITPNSCPLEATVEWTNETGTTSTCICKYKSRYFRNVHLEHDYEEGVVPFESYDTKDLFSPTPHHRHPLTIVSVYAEAGIKIIVSKKKRMPVPHPKRIKGQGTIWTNSELHSAMLEHFSIKKQPQWKVWLFSAIEYAISDVKGIMLTHKGKQRMGCAVFQRATGWKSSREKRLRLFIYVHEIGHCFNLPHPWNRSKANRPTLIKDNSLLSWMNYPWRYYSSNKFHGEEAFWKLFHFQFSDSELIHLRHGFRNDVIFGGSALH